MLLKIYLSFERKRVVNDGEGCEFYVKKYLDRYSQEDRRILKAKTWSRGVFR